MDLRKIFEEVNSEVRELLQKIRNIAKQQKSLWQQIPYLALQADGRSGYSDQFSRAYHQGYWAVGNTRNGCYRIYVDLETGELVDAYDPQRMAQDEDILSIIQHLHQLDAAEISKNLKARAKEPIVGYYNEEDRKAREERISSILQQGNIAQDSFRRIISPKEVHEANVIAPILDTLG